MKHAVLNWGYSPSRDRQLRMRSIRAFRVTTATTRCTHIRSAHAEARRPRGNSPLRPRARSVSHDKTILAGARTEPWRCPVRFRVPPFANQTFDRPRLSPWASTCKFGRRPGKAEPRIKLRTEGRRRLSSHVPPTSISRRQWSLGPHSSTPLRGRTVTFSWSPREAKA